MTLMLNTNITRVMNKSIFKICLLPLVCAFVAMACNRTPVDMPEEDYNQLFPFKGLEKPVINYEDMPILVGDPETSPQDYVYQGVTFGRWWSKTTELCSLQDSHQICRRR